MLPEDMHCWKFGVRNFANLLKGQLGSITEQRSVNIPPNPSQYDGFGLGSPPNIIRQFDFRQDHIYILYSVFTLFYMCTVIV